jgi:hypothetical protein
MPHGWEPVKMTDRLAEAPGHMALFPLISAVGKAFTITGEVLLLHPVDVCVKVKVTDPCDIPVTNPAFVTIAIAPLLLDHVPPEVGDNVNVLPAQTEGAAITTGSALTVTS